MRCHVRRGKPTTRTVRRIARNAVIVIVVITNQCCLLFGSLRRRRRRLLLLLLLLLLYHFTRLSLVMTKDKIHGGIISSSLLSWLCCIGTRHGSQRPKIGPGDTVSGKDPNDRIEGTNGHVQTPVFGIRHVQTTIASTHTIVKAQTHKLSR